MRAFKASFALFSAVALLVPALVLGATGTRIYEGHGVVRGMGLGGVEFNGTGKLEVSGNGTLTVSRNAIVKITGVGERAETDDYITWTGFEGKAMVRGNQVSGNLSGEVLSFVAMGKGRLVIEGDGEVSARPWFLKISGWKSVTVAK
jgi:hypothetical protein